MIITLVSDTFNENNNGTTISAKRFAQQLRQRGHEVRVVTRGEPTQSGTDPESGLRMYYVPEQWYPLVTRLAHKQNTLLAKPVKQVLTEAITGADVVHVYQPWPLDRLAGKIAKKLGIPAIAAFHIQPENITYNLGLGWLPAAAHVAYYLMYLLFYRHFEHIHCPSKFIAAQLRSHGYRAWLHVISNGVHPAFTPGTVPERFEDGRLHVVMVGRLSPEKRQAVLLKAVKKSRYAHRIQLHFAGTGPKAARLKKKGRKLPCPPEFGYYSREELIALLRKCDLCVHASDIEIEGMGCMEAFSCGLVPVISDSKRSATGQFALGEENLFRAGNAAELAERMDYWFENPDKLAEASAIYARLGREFALETSVRQMERVYAALKGRGRNVYHRSRVFNFLSRLLTYGVVLPVLFLWTRVVLGVRMRGKQHLRGLRGALTVCNHVHLLDSVLVGTAMYPRRMVFLTLKMNLDSLFPGALVNFFGGVPVPERIGDIKMFFDEMEIQLMRGRVVHFFPEGHLSPYDTGLRDFHKGAFRLAARARAPIVPLTIAFERPRGIYRLRRKPVMRIVVGEPIYPVHLDPKKDEAARMEMARSEMRRYIGR